MTETVTDKAVAATPDLKPWINPDTPPDIVAHLDALQQLTPSRGTLLPPADLAQLEELSPGAADRLITIAEKSLDQHSVALETHAEYSKQRIVAYLLVSLGLISTAALAIVLGPGWVSVPLGLGGVGTLVMGDLLGRKK